MYPKEMLTIYRDAAKLYQLPDTANVYRFVTETDSYGGILNDYRKVAEYKCRLVFKLEDTRVAGGVVLQDPNYKIHLDYNCDLKQNDRIYIKGDLDVNRYFEVISVENATEGLFTNAIVKERFN
jgi:hypothetical protein